MNPPLVPGRRTWPRLKFGDVVRELGQCERGCRLWVRAAATSWVRWITSIHGRAKSRSARASGHMSVVRYDDKTQVVYQSAQLFRRQLGTRGLHRSANSTRPRPAEFYTDSTCGHRKCAGPRRQTRRQPTGSYRRAGRIRRPTARHVRASRPAQSLDHCFGRFQLAAPGDRSV